MMAGFSRPFTLEVDGKPVLSFRARNFREANEICKESWLRSDLASLKSGGIPIFKTSAKLSVRPATTEEAAVFSHAADVAKPSDDMVLAYLVELDRPLIASPPWTAGEEAMLRAMADEGQRPAAIAKRLGRTEQAVRHRFYKLGIPLKARAQGT
jgi:hypothetical protein